MRSILSITALIAAPATASGLVPGTYTNEEEVYFDNEAGKVPAPWTGVRVDDDHQIIWIDAFG